MKKIILGLILSVGIMSGSYATTPYTIESPDCSITLDTIGKIKAKGFEAIFSFHDEFKNNVIYIFLSNKKTQENMFVSVGENGEVCLVGIGKAAKLEGGIDTLRGFLNSALNATTEKDK
jgi:hypothetical protein